MAIEREELDLNDIFKCIGHICKSEEVCHKCAEDACLVGYARNCTAKCRMNKQSYVTDGFANIPPEDIRGGYDEYEVLHGIAHLLMQCRSCKNDHFENCIINVVRSCFEAIEFGDEQEYEGDVLSYMMKIRDIAPEKAEIIADEYRRLREKNHM